MSVERKPPDFRRIWLWPLLIGIASMIGLISALLGDGLWDALSWATLGIPLAVTIVAAWRGLVRTSIAPGRTNRRTSA